MRALRITCWNGTRILFRPGGIYGYLKNLNYKLSSNEAKSEAKSEAKNEAKSEAEVTEIEKRICKLTKEEPQMV